MIEDFVLSLEYQKEEIYNALRPHFSSDILKYLVGGFFTEDKKRFVAFGITKIDTSFHSEYGYLFNYFEKDTYSVWQSTTTIEKSKKYINDTSYQFKSLQEMIEEGLYHHLLISFFGDFDFNEWHILPTYDFSDEHQTHDVYRRLLSKSREPLKDWLFENSIFWDTSKFFSQMNYPGRKSVIPVSTNMKPYLGHSHLVAIVRNERKTQINQAFENYVKKAFFEPFTVKLKTHFPEEYSQMGSFWASGCDMMYPDHKRFCLMIAFAIDKQDVPWMKCFVFIIAENMFYEWLYFPPEPYKNYGAYSEAIVDVFKPISMCDDMDYFREPECTLDDDEFWNNYVFKKENDKYVYLKEIRFDDIL